MKFLISQKKVRMRHDNVKLSKSLSDVSYVFPDKSWRFEFDNGEQFPDEDERVFDASAYKIRSILHGCQGEKLTLEYDYGDGWEVEITLESVFEGKELPGRELPRVLDGEGYGIIEDCGGVGGLKELAVAFQRKSGDDYENLREWLGSDELDLTAFDLDDMNLRLKKVPRIYMESYEYGLIPTQRSLDFLDRRYLK